MAQQVGQQAAQHLGGRMHRTSSIKESLASWGDIASLLRGGDRGALVPVVIPKDSRGLLWTAGLWFAAYLFVTAGLVMAGSSAVDWIAAPAIVVGVLAVALSLLWWWRSSIVEIEEGTVGILTRYGAIQGPGLMPGRHYLWHPWSRVDYVVDVTTEIPYAAPVLACPTHENVPLKSIEFFLKFRITDAVRFVQTIGAGNFDLVLSNSVQDAIRRRTPTTCAAPTSPTCRPCSTVSSSGTAFASWAATFPMCSSRTSTSSTSRPGSASARSWPPTRRSGSSPASAASTPC
jgi:hypothetical protein